MKPVRLTLFFTRGVSLGTWDTVGMFEREVALYRRLQTHGVRVAFVTYGGRSEYAFADRLPGIRILCNWPGWPLERYEARLHWLHGWHFWRSQVIKTNQTDGALAALRAAQFWRKPLVARCGYMWSMFMGHQYGEGSPTQRHVLEIEARVFSAADHMIVTTDEMAGDLRERIADAPEKTSVVPNYVETDRFVRPPQDPAGDTARPYDVIFVGRLEEAKNLSALLSAIDQSGWRLLLIGAGSQGDSLKREFAHLGEQVTWLSQVPNADLPAYYAQARVFALVSHYEGHPKTLIEAMACGLAVLGSDAPGIRTVITHGVNGWLCQPDAASIRQALEHLLGSAALRADLGSSARLHAEAHYSLDRVAGLELEIYRRLAGKRP